PVAVYLFYRSAVPPDLHSFPTRRSSDLEPLGHLRGDAVAGVGDDYLHGVAVAAALDRERAAARERLHAVLHEVVHGLAQQAAVEDRKSTRLNSSHVAISYAVFCLKKKMK